MLAGVDIIFKRLSSRNSQDRYQVLVKNLCMKILINRQSWLTWEIFKFHAGFDGFIILLNRPSTMIKIVKDFNWVALHVQQRSDQYKYLAIMLNTNQADFQGGGIKPPLFARFFLKLRLWPDRSPFRPCRNWRIFGRPSIWCMKYAHKSWPAGKGPIGKATRQDSLCRAGASHLASILKIDFRPQVVVHQCFWPQWRHLLWLCSIRRIAARAWPWVTEHLVAPSMCQNAR